MAALIVVAILTVLIIAILCAASILAPYPGLDED